ncbi:putative quinate permease [Diaporthe ampelina]|uniref:Putative quinate permease n=1 Tax=Diaporthe ampelina TaxID=1214573 RepID=A0A0G2HM99_9PEZI|nr:putative quinate permease [Diaporthe ampelina]
MNIYDFFDEDDVTTLTTSAAPLPGTLWINNESRYETLRHYEIAFACPRNGSSQVYFNFELDELEIRRHGELKSAISREELARVKALVVPMGHKESRSANNTLDNFRDTEPIDDLDEKLLQLHNMGLSTGLEPYDPDSPSKDTGLRQLAERLQQDIANRLRLPAELLSACPSLERVLIRPTATCGHWPTDMASLDDEDAWFLRGSSECFTCTLHWTARHLGFLVIDDPEEQAWSVGDACRPELGKLRETRMGQVTAAWYARVGSGAWEWEPEDERATRRTVADWALAATAIANKLVEPRDAEPFHVI